MQKSYEKPMIDFISPQFSLFLVAAIVLAFSPGPAITYVIARTASGGRLAGVASSFGASVGGLVHVVAAALGLSTLIAKSAFLFTVLKYVGACYLIYLGIRTLLSRESFRFSTDVGSSGNSKAFWQGFTVEVFNVKTALFFLAFIPQFINLSDSIALQFVIYGVICVSFNTIADLIAVYGVGYLLTKLKSTRLVNIISGSTLVGLGAFVAASEVKKI